MGVRGEQVDQPLRQQLPALPPDREAEAPEQRLGVSLQKDAVAPEIPQGGQLSVQGLVPLRVGQNRGISGVYQASQAAFDEPGRCVG